MIKLFIIPYLIFLILFGEKGVYKPVNKTGLDKLITCDYFKVDQLKYSEPFVKKSCHKFMDSLFTSYKKYCFTNKIKYSKPLITSILRTSESIRRLKKINCNAITNSSHITGNAFDVSYIRMSVKQKKSFLIILNDFKNSGLCKFVKERKQKCFHIQYLSK